MKRFILVMFVAGYNDDGEYTPSIVKIQTNDVKALVRKLAEDGQDIGVMTHVNDSVDEDSLGEVVDELVSKGHYDEGDGAWALTLIDTQNPDEFEDENGSDD